MGITFQELASKLRGKFNEMVNEGLTLYEVDADKDMLWNKYLGSFPEGTNPIYRKRGYYECSCCKSFIRKIGGTVFIVKQTEAEEKKTKLANAEKKRKILDILAEKKDESLRNASEEELMKMLDEME